MPRIRAVRPAKALDHADRINFTPIALRFVRGAKFRVDGISRTPRVDLIAVVLSVKPNARDKRAVDQFLCSLLPLERTQHVLRASCPWTER